MNRGNTVADDNRSDALRAAAQKRIELKQAISEVENATASASAQPAWRPRLAAALGDLNQALLRHVEEVEGSDGLLAELTREAPRLSRRIEEVRDEHPKLCHQATKVMESLDQDVTVGAIRIDVLDLLSAIARHRQAGADLVYEGYEVDLGGG